MGNLNGNIVLITCQVKKGNINEKSLVEVFNHDLDFTENEEYFRKNTLKKGFVNEAERCSTEIFNKHKKVKDESKRIEKMVDSLFDIRGFIGHSSSYGEYETQIIETDSEYIIIIATEM